MDSEEVPTQEEIVKLPRWARVGFAARCARRVFPLVKANWKKIKQEQYTALGLAIDIAESSAAAAVIADSTYAATAAAFSAADAYARANPKSRPSIRHDFNTVLALSKRENWTDDTPCPPSIFGPMWPFGVPDDWPEEDPDLRLKITLGVPADFSAEEIADAIGKLHETANALSISEGGMGFTLDEFRQKVNVRVQQPVGVS